MEFSYYYLLLMMILIHVFWLICCLAFGILKDICDCDIWKSNRATLIKKFVSPLQNGELCLSAPSLIFPSSNKLASAVLQKEHYNINNAAGKLSALEWINFHCSAEKNWVKLAQLWIVSLTLYVQQHNICVFNVFFKQLFKSMEIMEYTEL